MKYIEYLENFLSLLENHSGLFTILVVISGGLWAFVKFRDQVKDKRFKTYHDLIGWLVDEQIREKGLIKLDRQIAVVYELRNFPKYFEVSTRILEGLAQDWKDGDPRIKKEIELSLTYMKRNWFIRKFKK